MKSQLSILKRYINLVYNISKGYIFFAFLSALFGTLIPLINIVMPKYIIDELLNTRRYNLIANYIIITVLSNFVIKILKSKIDQILLIKNHDIQNEIKLQTGKKIMEMDFENVEDPKILDFQKRALQPIETQGVLFTINKNISDTLKHLFTLITVVIIIFVSNYWLIGIIILINLLAIYFQKKDQKINFSFYESSIPINRIYLYYMFELQDFSYGKEIRLYNMQPLITKRAKKFNDMSMKLYKNLKSCSGKYKGINMLLNRLQSAIVYAFMTFQVIKKKRSRYRFIYYVCICYKHIF